MFPINLASNTVNLSSSTITAPRSRGMKQKAGIVIDETDSSDKSDQEDEASADKENVALFNSNVIDLTIEEVDQFKIKFIKFASRYFFCRRNPSDRLLRYFIGKQFGLDPNLGVGYAVFKSGARAFNTMRYEFYKTTRQLADSYISKHTGYIEFQRLVSCQK